MPKISKHLRWNVQSEEGDPPTHNFVVLAIENRRTSNKIKQRLKVNFQPTSEMTETQGKFKTGNLYRIIKFTSYRRSLDALPWSEIYDVKTIHDEDLTERNSREGLASYVEGKGNLGLYK